MLQTRRETSYKLISVPCRESIVIRNVIDFELKSVINTLFLYDRILDRAENSKKI